MNELVDSAQANRERLLEGVALLAPWFHCIELPGGVMTKTESTYGEPVGYPGDTCPRFDNTFPSDLRGKSVLDIGCNGGYYCLEAVRRGAARVVGVEAYYRFVQQARFAAQAWGYGNVEIRQGTVYDVSYDRFGTFDVVLALGLIYHLKHFYAGLERLFEVTGDLLIVETAVTTGPEGGAPLRVVSDNKPYHFAALVENSASDTEAFANWFIPSVDAAIAALKAVGFEDIKFVSLVRDRAIISARKPSSASDSTAPAGLRAEFKKQESICVEAGKQVQLEVDVANAGFRRWLPPEGNPGKGAVYLRPRLYCVSDPLFSEFLTWVPIASAIAPQGHCTLQLNFPAPLKPGRYELELDMYAHEVAIFQDCGSSPLILEVDVR